jgi:NAD+ diphosphatase
LTVRADFQFCPRCATPLVTRTTGGRERLVCPREGCGFVHWGNPTPVVAAIIDLDGRIVLARGATWPEKMFGLVTGFLEAKETPEAGVLREVKEELGLDATVVRLVGVHPFELRNELIVTFFVKATGTITLSDELAEFKLVDPDKLRAWPFGTGLAVQQWLDDRARGA